MSRESARSRKDKPCIGLRQVTSFFARPYWASRSKPPRTSDPGKLNNAFPGPEVTNTQAGALHVCSCRTPVDGQSTPSCAWTDGCLEWPGREPVPTIPSGAQYRSSFAGTRWGIRAPNRDAVCSAARFTRRSVSCLVENLTSQPQAKSINRVLSREQDGELKHQTETPLVVPPDSSGADGALTRNLWSGRRGGAVSPRHLEGRRPLSGDSASCRRQRVLFVCVLFGRPRRRRRRRPL